MQRSAFRTELTHRFDEALLYASKLHSAQRRKRSGCPYIAHLLGVCSLVLEDGGDEDQAIAALLHDAVEDQGGTETLNAIADRFGQGVASIVLACSDSHDPPKPPWRERKEKFIASLSTKSKPAIRVISADKLYNARTVLRDFRQIGDDLWAYFRGGKAGSLWYYRTITDELRKLNPGSIVDELHRVVSTLEARQEQDRA